MLWGRDLMSWERDKYFFHKSPQCCRSIVLCRLQLSRKCSFFTRPRSAVGKVSGNRCESNCRSKGREFDPDPVPYFDED